MLSAFLCGPSSVSLSKLITRRHLIQPVEALSNWRTKFITRTGRILTVYRVRLSASFLPFHYPWRRSLTHLVLRLSFDTRTIRTLVASSTSVPKFLPSSEVCFWYPPFLSHCRYISIDMQWIPWDLNVIADDIGKLVDYNDYTIKDSVFYAIDELWGPHTCNRFASHYNATFQKFNTRYYQPSSSGVHALKIGRMTTTGCVHQSV